MRETSANLANFQHLGVDFDNAGLRFEPRRIQDDDTSIVNSVSHLVKAINHSSVHTTRCARRFGCGLLLSRHADHADWLILELWVRAGNQRKDCLSYALCHAVLAVKAVRAALRAVLRKSAAPSL